MKIKIVNLEKELILLNKEKGSLSNGDILNFCIKNNELLEDYENEIGYKNNIEGFSKSLCETLDKYPNLLDNIEDITNEIDINENIVQSKISILSELSNSSGEINVIMMYGGFNEGICTYNNNIYYSMEWFIKPEDINVAEDEVKFKCLNEYSKYPEEVMYNTIIHEVVHLCSATFKNRKNALWHLVEEGRASYIANMLEERKDLGLLISEEDLCWCKDNEEGLLKEVYNAILENDNDKYLKFISPKRSIKGISRCGYYLGYVLVERYMKSLEGLNEMEKMENLLLLDSTEPFDDILKEIRGLVSV